MSVDVATDSYSRGSYLHYGPSVGNIRFLTSDLMRAIQVLYNRYLVNGYSLLKLFTGLAKAAFTAWKPTVI